MTRDVVAPDGRVLLTLAGEQVEALGLDRVLHVEAAVGDYSYVAQVGTEPGDPVWLLPNTNTRPIVPGDVVRLRRVQVGVVR